MTAEENHKLVFIVDDDPGALMLTSIALRRLWPDLEVETFEEGRVCLHSLESRRSLPNVVLLDWNLPYMHGSEVLSAIRGDIRLVDLPVVVVTTSSASADSNQAASLGAEGYIVKQSDMSAFTNALKSTLGSVLRA